MHRPRLSSPKRRGPARLLGLLTAAIGLAALVGDASADDRNLFRGAADAPYIFALFDTSGSMASPATCNLENCDTLGAADAPDSRMYQLKSALYDIVRDDGNANVRWGFAKFNQISPQIFRKAWLYKRKPGQTWNGSDNPPWWDRVQWPALDDQVWFGDDGNAAQAGTSCGSYTPTEADSRLYLSDFPKLGHTGETAFEVWFSPNDDGLDLRIRVNISGMTVPAGADSAYTAEIALTVQVRTYTSCSGFPTNNWRETVAFVPYYEEDFDGVEFRDGSGALGFDFIAREGNFVTPNTRNRWDEVGSMHSYGGVCDSDSAGHWEPNENASTGSSDGDSSSVLERPNWSDPLDRGESGAGSCQGEPFERGDVLPWDWIQHPQDPDNVATGFEFSSRQEVLYRLAPNTAVDGEHAEITASDLSDAGGPYDATRWEVGDPIPDFRVARYFEDVPDGGEISLKSQFANYPPLIAGGGTPLTGMLQDLQLWAEGWEPCANDDVDGDRTYKCRQRFAILLTDGILGGGCGGNPAAAAEALYNATRLDLTGDGDGDDEGDGPGIRTLVVGFGAFLTGGTTSSQLREIATAGGTGTDDVDGDGTTDCDQFSPRDDDGNVTFDLCATDGVILASDKDQLVDVLGAVIGDLVTAPTSFATAAVPQSQAVSGDSIFLASFVPTENQPYYAGKLWHFARPVPLETVDGNLVPDTDLLCDPSDEEPEGCLVWDADASMRGENGAFDQVPTLTESATDLQIGAATNNRRIYYSLDPTAGGTVASGADDVGRTMRWLLPTTDTAVREDLRLGFGLPAATTTATDASLQTIFRRVVSERESVDSEGTFQFILGDIFHSDPIFVGEPLRAEFLIDEPVPVADPCGTGQEAKYGCFFAKHRFRRHVVFAGANDGQLHAFDAGEFESDQQGGREVGTYSLGTGQELFSFIPRELMPSVRTLVTSSTHDFRFDGVVRVDDVFIDPLHTGTPTADDREWRTVLISGFREGGRGYVALDITQPDPVEEVTLGSGASQTKYFVPDSSDYVPDCLTSVAYDADECGPVPYGTALWEISDDQTDFAELGDTWSRPNTGKVRITVGGSVEERFVAVFGGGLDPDDPNGRIADPSRGRHLYIVDIETGEVLYKRELDGSSIPSDPAAVDTDGNGILDTIYIGTFGGLLYKVDISSAATLDGNGQVASGQWDPLAIFCTGTWDSGTSSCTGSRPIFFPPSVIFVGSRGRFALAFGTGPRNDLWDASRASDEGRFYVILDTGFGEELDMTTLPLTESSFDVIAADAPDENVDRLTDPLENGYVLALEEGEKLFTPAFALSGLLVFNTVLPTEDTELSGGATLCEFGANTNIYTIFTTSGDALSPDEDQPRFFTVEGPVGTPFTEINFAGSLGGDNDDGGDDGDDTGDGGDDGGDEEDAERERLEGIRQELMSFFPPNCRFSAATVDVKAVRSDTGIEFIAPVPICVIQKNWKEL